VFLELTWIENDVQGPRFGMIVPRHRQTAVARNRLRRRLREVWRREVQAVQPAWDLLVRARREAYGATFAQLRAELASWRDATCPAA
jgi:ribonuclease P protein component